MLRPSRMKRQLRAFWCRRQTTLGWISFLIVMLIWANMHLLTCVTENSDKVPHQEDICPPVRLSSEQQTTVKGPGPFHVEARRLTVDPKKALLYGRMRANQSELTIGIPTVQRRGVDYLEKTLYSLITQTKASHRTSIVVVIFMVDRNETWTNIRSKQLAGKYPRLIQNGFLQIVHPHDQSIYPDFTKLKRTFNDTSTRVAWRSKQNIDYAYLFSYCKGISRYYLQLEDDVIAASNYYDDIMNFIKSKSNTFWYCLEFSFLGFIGKLIRSSDLQELSEYILMFFDEQPGDLLLKALKTIKTQWKDIQIKRSLFQHKGVVSSLTAKEQHLYDGHFKDITGFNLHSRKRFYHVNPSAMIDSKIDTYSDYEPMHAYDLSDKYFWGISPKQGDYFRITFEGPQNISRLFIDSGEATKTSDMLHHARLLVSTAVEVDKSCQNLVNITDFVDGDVDTRKSNISLPGNIDCIVIEITDNQTDWVIIREIAIFLPGEQEVEEQSKEENAPQLQGESNILKWQTWKRHEVFKPAFLSPRFENGVLVMPGQKLNQNWREAKWLNDKRQINPNQNQQHEKVWREPNEKPDNRKNNLNRVNIERSKHNENILDIKQKHGQVNGVYLSNNDQHLLELWQHELNMKKMMMRMNPMEQNIPMFNKHNPPVENRKFDIDGMAQNNVPLHNIPPQPIENGMAQNNVPLHKIPPQLLENGMAQNNVPLHNIPPQLKENKQFEMDHMAQNNVPLHNIPPQLKENKQFEMDHMAQNNVPLHNIPPQLLENKQFEMNGVKQNNVPVKRKAGSHIRNLKRREFRQPKQKQRVIHKNNPSQDD